MTIEVFISYSHKDQTFREELEIHLSNLKRQNIISSWYDGNIAPGSELEPQIIDHLMSAQIILLLISADFIHSDFCYSIEMKQAIDRHNAREARVIPIVLRPTDWQGAPFDTLKILPTDAKAVTKWRRRDDAFADIVQGIRASINDLTIMGKTANPSIVADTSSPGKTQEEQIWNLPFQRNSLFTGREDVLIKLSEALRAGKTAAIGQPQAISGLGGIGKTQTAVEYAYRNRDNYKAILWVKAETEGSINTDFATIASLLDLQEKLVQDQHKIIEAVKRWFQEHTDWLLILDNADDIAMVQGFLPLGGKGHVLLTTRAHATGRIAQRIEVEKMEPYEGALFLLHRAKLLDPNVPLKQASEAQRNKAQDISEATDGLPLALDQAGAYLEETSCGLVGYLDLFQKRGAALLKRRGGLVADHPEPVATTWSLSFEKVEQTNPAAAELLYLCAFLAPDAIPEEIISEGASELGHVLQPVAANPYELNAAIEAVLKFSLVKRDPEAKTLSIHRLVQAVIKEGMDQNTQRRWAQRATGAVRAALPAVEHGTWSAWERVVTHTQACAQLLERYRIQRPETADLLQKTGWYLTERARYGEAEPLLAQAYAMSAQAQGLEHLDTARDGSTLAYLYKAQGKYEQAEPLYQRALAIREQQLGEMHPGTANSLNNLAALYYNLSKYEQAEPLFKRALVISEQVLGPDHPNTAQSLYWLAYIYSNQGKYRQAEPLYQRTLKIYKKTLPPDHPNIAGTLENYASLLRKMNRIDEATTLEKRASEIRAKRSS